MFGRVNIVNSGAVPAATSYSVKWNYGITSTALTRLTPVSAEPVAAIGTVGGSSPFDNIMPWSGMEEYNVIGNVIGAKRGETGFSRSSDTVVSIPKFWYKIEKNTAAKTMTFSIANGLMDGFSVHPAFSRGDGAGERDYIYVGKYNTGSGYVSKTGQSPLVSITRATARTNSAAKGSKWWQYDYASYSAIWLLYLVEFADWNSQSKIGKGYTDSTNTAAINSGGCDSMTYHTGRAAGTDGMTAVMYRWIENLWGNVYEWVDGFNASERLVYICLNPANFADDTTSNYTSTGITLCSSGWIKELGLSINFSFAFLPITNGGSETTCIPDYVGSLTGWRTLSVGGYWSYAGRAGLFYFNANSASSNTSTNVGARLLFLP